jgi:hypothetical protein
MGFYSVQLGMRDAWVNVHQRNERNQGFNSGQMGMKEARDLTVSNWVCEGGMGFNSV